MLETGFKLLECEIIKPVSENKVYESYLVRSGDVPSAKMFVSTAKEQDQAADRGFLEITKQLLSYEFPGVGTPIKAGEYESQPVCVYPLPVGQALVDCRLGQQLPVRESLQFVKSVAERLVAPHQSDFAHGNLSPSTVYLHDNVVYLDDFALSQLLKLDYQTGINPAHTSPEQVRGDKPVPASDIYSLGTIFYYLLSGESPFSGTDAFSISMKHLQGVFPALPEGHCCTGLLLSMTSGSADKRPTAEEVIEKIDHLLDSDELDHAQPVIESSQNTPDSEEKLDDEFALFSDKNDDFTARIEARLKEHSYTVPAEGERLPDENDAETATEGLDPVHLGRRRKGLRFVLVLITGLLLGSVAYQLLDRASFAPTEGQSFVESEINAQLDQALVVWQQNEIDTAIERFEQLNILHPEDPRPANNLAAIYAAQGDYDSARDYLESALKTSLEYATIYENLAAIYAEMARESYGKALQIDAEPTSVNLTALSSQGVVRMDSIGTQSLPADTESAGEPVEVAASESSAILMAASEGVSEVRESETAPEIQNETDVTSEPEESSDSVEITDRNSEPPASETPAVSEVQDNSSDPVPASVASMDDFDSGDPPMAVSAESAVEFLERWADAWSEQDVDRYLTFYGESFNPPGGRQRVDWENQRRKRISGPKLIRVSLSDFQIVDHDDWTRVELIQIYESDVFKDETRKIFDLKRSEDQWSILRERSLGSVR